MSELDGSQIAAPAEPLSFASHRHRGRDDHYPAEGTPGREA
jgi:hypothetical protein